ncbi:hypothetical protein MJO29_003521 [Puccinia striiformis f. sp. tritici]|uniref:hypothetical protein n=1 Tax=Puccinia striiformis f. sp. tritici TaxID=168172 RepID=UPI002007BD4C|nr:hypothetical protein Pst134EA_004624 [Puccinia striiformis f. sp. tritici]KAH9470702.1 hypothetical protein Pst134EA_004624 [Puccinia striiformis f. sp. tritici]KAI7965423.1 hypothetical protein MJO29_003521 [Puccinia striiformis f. sp. tritici]
MSEVDLQNFSARGTPGGIEFRCQICPNAKAITVLDDVQKHTLRPLHRLIVQKDWLTSSSDGQTSTDAVDHHSMRFEDYPEVRGAGMSDEDDDEMDEDSQNEDDQMKAMQSLRPLMNGNDSRQADKYQEALEAELEAIEKNVDLGHRAQRHLNRYPNIAARNPLVLPPENNPFYPFKDKMELMGVKMLGIQNPGVGKAFYSHVRMVMTIMKLHLPAWEASQAARIRVKLMLDRTVSNSTLPVSQNA